MSKAIGCARADVFRGIAVYSGADFLSGCDGGKSPIAFYGSHATDDPTNPYSSGITILNRFAANNGCTALAFRIFCQLTAIVTVGAARHF